MAEDAETLAPEAGNPASEQTPAQAVTEATPEPAAAVEPEVKPDWPDDWRDKLAKGDEKTRKRLDRFQSPGDVLRSWQELEKKLSSGDVKSKLPTEATPEQIAAYRRDNGIPEKPEGYLEKLPNGLVIGDEDKPLVAAYLEKVHGKNADPAVVADTLDWYYAQQEQAAAARAEADKAYRTKSNDELRAEWGAEYRGNLNSIMSFLDTAPQAEDGTPLKSLLLGARLADGTALGDNPAALRWLARLANDANPAGFIAPGAGLSQIDGVKAEIASIEKTMREKPNVYFKDEAMQARLRQLYDAEEKLSAR